MFLVSGSGFQVSSFRFRVLGFEFQVSSFEFQVSRFGVKAHILDFSLALRDLAELSGFGSTSVEICSGSRVQGPGSQV